MPDPVRDYLRHTLATLAYRAGKAVRGVPPEVAAFSAGPSTRTPLQILAHVNDLLDWALSLCKGTQHWNVSRPVSWEAEVERLFAGLGTVDAFLASEQPLEFPPEKLFQGPVADALTHVGQIAMLRRLAGSPVKGENYFQADIARGRVGAEQSAPRFEFD